MFVSNFCMVVHFMCTDAKTAALNEMLSFKDSLVVVVAASSEDG